MHEEKKLTHNAVRQCLGILLHVHEIAVVASRSKHSHGGKDGEEKASTTPYIA